MDVFGFNMNMQILTIENKMMELVAEISATFVQKNINTAGKKQITPLLNSQSRLFFFFQARHMYALTVKNKMLFNKHIKIN